MKSIHLSQYSYNEIFRTNLWYIQNYHSELKCKIYLSPGTFWINLLSYGLQYRVSIKYVIRAMDFSSVAVKT